MDMVKTATIMDEVLDFLTSAPTPQQIIDFQLSEEAQARARKAISRLMKQKKWMKFAVSIIYLFV